jgi:RimJ/RimL family protein N-acetyltransferase
MTWINDSSVVGNIAAFSGAAMTRADELLWIEKTLASPSDIVFSVLAADDGRYLGQIGLHQIYSRARVARLGLVIAAKSEMGKGFGTAAIDAILHHAFNVLDLHKIWLMIFSDNTRSASIYQRIGFVNEGTLREEYLHHGTWHDMTRMSMLQREWRAKRAR